MLEHVHTIYGSAVTVQNVSSRKCVEKENGRKLQFEIIFRPGGEGLPKEYGSTKVDSKGRKILKGNKDLQVN